MIISLFSLVGKSFPSPGGSNGATVPGQAKYKDSGWKIIGRQFGKPGFSDQRDDNKSWLRGKRKFHFVYSRTQEGAIEKERLGGRLRKLFITEAKQSQAINARTMYTDIFSLDKFKYLHKTII